MCVKRPEFRVLRPWHRDATLPMSGELFVSEKTEGRRSGRSQSRGARCETSSTPPP